MAPYPEYLVTQFDSHGSLDIPHNFRRPVFLYVNPVTHGLQTFRGYRYLYTVTESYVT